MDSAADFTADIELAHREARRQLALVWPGRRIDVRLDPGTLRHPASGNTSVWINGLASIEGLVVEICVRSPQPGPFAIGAAPVSVDCATWVNGRMQILHHGADLCAIGGVAA